MAAEAPPEAAGATRSGQYSGWLQKKKSGSAVVRLRQYNKRYFTLDFNTRTFYYTHSPGAGNQKASGVVPFGDLVDVHAASSAAQAEPVDDSASVTSKQSKMSLLRRMGSFNKNAEDQEHTLAVLLRTDKRMELLCASAGEAAEWLGAFKEALALGGGEGAAAAAAAARAPTSPGESEDASGYPSAAAGKPPRAPPAAGMSGDTHSPAAGAEGAAGATAGTAIAAAAAAAAGADDGEQPQSAPRGPSKNFLDFDAIEEEVRPGEEPARNAQAEGATVTEISAAGVSQMQAQDFGFGAEDDKGSSGSSTSSSPRSAGNAGGITAVSAASPEAGAAGAGDAAGSPSVGTPPCPISPGAGVRSQYKDRDEGKTMQERLANLEFSDDEDEDDDDPLGLKQKAGTG